MCVSACILVALCVRARLDCEYGKLCPPPLQMLAKALEFTKEMAWNNELDCASTAPSTCPLKDETIHAPQ